MNIKCHFNGCSLLLAIYLLLLNISMPAFAGGVPNIPQIPAFLPTVDNVAATKPMPLDGIWLINGLGKKVRIESGRAYAVDGWLHLFVLKIQPGMVVFKNISPTGPGQYSGEDLPLIGKWDAKVQANRSLAVTVAGTLGPVNYTMTPVQLDKPDWYAQEMTAAGLTAPPASGTPTAPPAYQPAPPPGSAPVQPIQPIDGEEELIPEDEGEGLNPEDEDEGLNPEDEDEGLNPEDEDEEYETVSAKKHERYSCKGKGVYYSKVGGKKRCYTCPKGFKRTKLTRKMDHAKACVNRKGKNTYKKAKGFVKNVKSCDSNQYKHQGFCKSCPEGYAPEIVQRMTGGPVRTGKCKPKTET